MEGAPRRAELGGFAAGTVSNGYSGVTVGFDGRAGGFCGKGLRGERAERSAPRSTAASTRAGGGGTQAWGRSWSGAGLELGAGPGHPLRALYGVTRAWAGAGFCDWREPGVARIRPR